MSENAAIKDNSSNKDLEIRGLKLRLLGCQFARNCMRFKEDLKTFTQITFSAVLLLYDL